MTAEHLKSLILTSLAAFVLMAVGRMVNMLSGAGKTAYASPLHSLLTGAGVWYFLFLFVCVSQQFSMTTAWWGFFTASILCLLTFLRLGRKRGDHDHYWPQVLIAFVALIPAFFYVATDVPLLPAELTGTLHIGQSLFELGGEFTAQVWPSAWVSYLSASLMGMQWVIAAPAVLNVILLALIAMWMVHVVNVRVRWSNMALVAGCSILAVSVLNPLLDFQLLLATEPDFILSAILLAAISPLLMKEKLPQGYKVLPQAVILALLVGCHETGFYWAGLILFFWVIRLWLVEWSFNVASFFGLVLMVTLPLLSFYTWNLHTEMPWPWVMGKTKLPLEEILVTQGRFAVAAIVLTAIAAMGLMNRDWRSPLERNASYTLALLAFVFVTALIVFGEKASYTHVQFILLVPLWKIYLRWYEKSEIKEMAYHTPWVAGSFLILTAWAIQALNQGYLNQSFSTPMQHTLAVAESIQSNKGVDKSSRIAVLDVKADGYYAAVLSYGLNGQKVEDASQGYVDVEGQLSAYHRYLNERGFDYLWIHAPTDVMRENINRSLRSDHSYLFKIYTNKIRLVDGGVYPHLGYSQP